MIEAMLAVILIMVGLGTKGYIGTSPQRLRDSGFLSGKQPACREYTAAEFRVLGNEPKGKASTYSMDGEFICERKIFEYGERDSFYDFIVDVAPSRIAKAARNFAQLQETVPEFSSVDTTWSVRVVTDAEPLRTFVTELVRTEFVGYMKKGSMSNMSAIDAKTSVEHGAVIEVSIDRIQDRDLVLKAEALTMQGSKRRRWSL